MYVNEKVSHGDGHDGGHDDHHTEEVWHNLDKSNLLKDPSNTKVMYKEEEGYCADVHGRSPRIEK